MADHGVAPDIVHTSLQTRAIHTTELALRAMGRSWIPVRRDWRLNERHYGDLTGRNKTETPERYGADQVQGVAPQLRRPAARRSPPTTSTTRTATSATPRCHPASCPLTECLKDVVARLLPCWDEVIVPDLRAGLTVLVGAHGNSLRALVKHLDDISDADIVELNIPTGEPLVYELDDDLRPVDAKPVEERYLRSPEEIRAAAEAVARQAEGG